MWDVAVLVLQVACVVILVAGVIVSIWSPWRTAATEESEPKPPQLKRSA